MAHSQWRLQEGTPLKMTQLCEMTTITNPTTMHTNSLLHVASNILYLSEFDLLIAQLYSNRDWKMAHKTGSNAELTYMAAVMDFPYHQNRFQSLPRVNALPPLELWDDLTNEEQIVQWINHTNWSAQAQHSPNGFASNHPIGNNKVRVLDIVDTNRGVSGQIDTYLDPESSYYPGSGSLTQPEQALPPDTSRVNVMINNSQPMDSINDLPDFGLVEDEVHFTDTPSLCHSFEVDNPSAFLALDL